MVKGEPVEVEGVVIEMLPHTLYRLELETKERIVAHVSHEPRCNFVRILMGDRVRVCGLGARSNAGPDHAAVPVM